MSILGDIDRAEMVKQMGEFFSAFHDEPPKFMMTCLALIGALSIKPETVVSASFLIVLPTVADEFGFEYVFGVGNHQSGKRFSVLIDEWEFASDSLGEVVVAAIEHMPQVIKGITL